MLTSSSCDPHRQLRSFSAATLVLASSLLLVCHRAQAQEGLGHLPAQSATYEGPDRCVVPASSYHGVNGYILLAILRVESRMRPGTVSRNSNGTMDLGIGGINSIHLPELRRHGIGPQDLLDACVGTYVAAWKLRKKMVRWGNNWFGIAAYHSETPKYNSRYQIMLHNELVAMGVIQGRRLPVPRLAS
jgi:soluble lytic murein transglycosylase-like protein